VEMQLIRDFFGMSVPQHGLPDIGYFESDAQLLETDSESAASDIKKVVNLDIYPNPSPGLVNVRFEENIDSLVLIEILDINGNRVHKVESANERLIPINLENQSKGIYFAIISVGGHTLSRKIVLN